MRHDDLQIGDSVQIIGGPGVGQIGRVSAIEHSKAGEVYENPYMVESEAFTGVFYSRGELRKVE